jgi:hypothetical protein
VYFSIQLFCDVRTDCEECSCSDASNEENIVNESNETLSERIGRALEEIPVKTLIDEAKQYWNNPKRLSHVIQWDLIFNVGTPIVLTIFTLFHLPSLFLTFVFVNRQSQCN